MQTSNALARNHKLCVSVLLLYTCDLLLACDFERKVCQTRQYGTLSRSLAHSSWHTSRGEERLQIRGRRSRRLVGVAAIPACVLYFKSLAIVCSRGRTQAGEDPGARRKGLTGRARRFTVSRVAG